MKTYKILISFLMMTTLLISSCQDFEELEKDPNRPASVPASLVFNGILNDMHEGSWNDVMRWNQFYASNYNYYSNNEYNWTSTGLNYTTLKNVIKMEQEAKKSGLTELNPYNALGKFFRAYFFVNMTQRVGDIPMNDALKGLENATPVYNTQKEVYAQSLQWLAEANDELTQLIASSDNSLAGDIYLNNDLKKWQKIVNAFKLRILISLSKKEADTELNVKQKFAEMVNSPDRFPLLSDVNESLQYIYNAQFNKYPRNKDNYGNNATRENMAATYLNTLVILKDPRTFVVAEPATKKVDSGISPTDFAAFAGARSDEDLANMATKAGNGDYSFQNRKRYYDGYTAEPDLIIGYPEMCFNIAEGINRGWTGGSAEDYYKKGILASMSFYGISTGTLQATFLKKGGKLGDYETFPVNVNLDAYYNQSTIKYAGNDVTGLNQILTQKYLAFFQNSGWEAFYNQRRTGVPTFFTSEAGNGNSGRIPKRWQYPATEANYNAANYNEAIGRQFGGKDDINTELWLLK